MLLPTTIRGGAGDASARMIVVRTWVVAWSATALGRSVVNDGHEKEEESYGNKFQI
jgi:hypothetical protein